MKKKNFKVERKEQKMICRWCKGMGYSVSKTEMKKNSFTAHTIICRVCGGTGEKVDYYYVIEHKGYKYITDTFK